MSNSTFFIQAYRFLTIDKTEWRTRAGLAAADHSPVPGKYNAGRTLDCHHGVAYACVGQSARQAPPGLLDGAAGGTS